MSVLKQFEHLKIQLEAIELATSNFAEDSCIGKGGFGKVYKGKLYHSKGHTTVALKRLDRTFGQGDSEFWKEVIMLSVYRHENIVSLLGFCDEKDEKILVYEYSSRRSLDLHLDSNDLTWIRRLKICIGAARGLAYLHNPSGTQQRVLHRDIKSSNILLDENWDAKIADLGLSRFGPANQKYTFLVTNNRAGTAGYCDPLYLESGILTKESDVYSFGVVLFEVLCGRLCFESNDKPQTFTQLVRKHYKQKNLNEIIWGNIKDEIHPSSLKVFSTIAYQCLKNDNERRPSMNLIVSELESALEYQSATGVSGADGKVPSANKLGRCRGSVDEYKSLQIRGVDDKNLIQNLHNDPREDIKRHVCVGLVKRVSLFKNMNERLLDDICQRLKPRLYTKNSYIIKEGDPVNEMLFIIHGHLETETTDRFFNNGFLKEGDLCGDELLIWALDPESGANLPPSIRTLKALRDVEAFALPAEQLKFIVLHFKGIHNRQVRHAYRFYSKRWRTWAACFIQAAWRRYSKTRVSGEEEAELTTHDNAGVKNQKILMKLRKPPDPSFTDDSDYNLVLRAFGFYSPQWRTRAACFIQAEWRKHTKRKLSEQRWREEANSSSRPPQPDPEDC
ncbi:hypothetical protein LXL04_028998 [Taraxacum kok-saghyz]